MPALQPDGLDATAQGELVRRGEVTSAQLVEAALARINARDGLVNAVVSTFDPAAVTQRTQTLDQLLAGVPLLVKDLVADVADTPMTSGSRLADGCVRNHDSELVLRLRRAGLVLIGKTNVPEFGILGTTESQLLGPCRNPWDPDHSVGGSSGGAAAVVAARMVPVAHGSDGGGSIRIPASCCGVFGLKPSRAAIPGPRLRGSVRRFRRRACSHADRAGQCGAARHHERAGHRRPVRGEGTAWPVRRGGRPVSRPASRIAGAWMFRPTLMCIRHLHRRR